MCVSIQSAPSPGVCRPSTWLSERHNRTVDALAQRRGGGERPVTLDSEIAANAAGPAAEILEVHAALDSLAQYDPRLVQVVELRYFAGMTDGQVAEALGIGERTVRRDWE
jgi:DNA-directed RNA polymerase specialized sigma24 family protein